MTEQLYEWKLTGMDGTHACHEMSLLNGNGIRLHVPISPAGICWAECCHDGMSGEQRTVLHRTGFINFSADGMDDDDARIAAARNTALCVMLRWAEKDHAESTERLRALTDAADEAGSSESYWYMPHEEQTIHLKRVWRNGQSAILFRPNGKSPWTLVITRPSGRQHILYLSRELNGGRLITEADRAVIRLCGNGA